MTFANSLYIGHHCIMMSSSSTWDTWRCNCRSDDDVQTHIFFVSPPVVSRMSSGGCSFPSQSCSSTSPHLPSLSIKSERSSPEHMSSPTSPSVHHLRQHSPMSNPDSARHTPPEACSANETKEFPKGGYPQDEVEGGQPLRQLEISDGWQR